MPPSQHPESQLKISQSINAAKNIITIAVPTHFATLRKVALPDLWNFLIFIVSHFPCYFDAKPIMHLLF